MSIELKKPCYCPRCTKPFYWTTNICPNCKLDFDSKEFDVICKLKGLN